MARFDPDEFASMLEVYIEVADADIKNELRRELNSLRGLTDEQIERFGGTTEQVEAIINEVESAADGNLQQAELIENLKKLGESTYGLARKVLAIVP